MSMVRIDWNPDAAAMRSFGRTVFIGFTIIGTAIWLFGGALAATRESETVVWGSLPWFVGISGAIWALAAALPAAARPIRRQRARCSESAQPSSFEKAIVRSVQRITP